MNSSKAKFQEPKKEIKELGSNKKYPVKFVIIHSILVSLISVTIIVLEVIMIINEFSFYEKAIGIWVGISFIVAVLMEIILSLYIVFF